MSNRETRQEAKFLHILMAISRTKDGQKTRCIRTVLKDPELDLKMLEAKLHVLGGEWRIHKTVNARDVEKARKILIHMLIDHEEMGAFVDSQWRTALLQSQCTYGDKRFLLDIDTLNPDEIAAVEAAIAATNGIVEERVRTPNGWHFITKPFDTRPVCELGYVSLLRDGYVFIKTVSAK